MIQTRRLRLLTLPPDDHAHLSRRLAPSSVVAPAEMVEGPDPVPIEVHRRQAAVAAADPNAVRWLLRAIVLADDTMVGHIGFHETPRQEVAAFGDPSFDGDVPQYDGAVGEFGYTVFTAHRRQGIATEAATGLVEWAVHDEGLAGVVATTDPDNVASQRVLTRAGLVVVGRGFDERRGIELIWWRPGTA